MSFDTQRTTVITTPTTTRIEPATSISGANRHEPRANNAAPNTMGTGFPYEKSAPNGIVPIT